MGRYCVAWTSCIVGASAPGDACRSHGGLALRVGTRMSLLRNIASGLRSLFRREQLYQELDEELGAYLEMEAAEKMKQGMSRREALRAVRLERGSLEVTKEVVRSAGWESIFQTLLQDLRFGARMLRKSP